MMNKTNQELIAEIQALRASLEEAQETLDAIRRGEVDGLVVSTPKGEQVYTITSAEKPYRILIEEMREGAVMISDDNAVLYCNAGFARMLKQPMEKIVGANIESFVCPTHREALKELLSMAKARPDSVTKEISLKSRDDDLVPTLISVNSLRTDNSSNTFLVVTNLSEHMEEEVKQYTAELELAQIALSESEQRWATTLSSIGDAVISTDISGKIKFMNRVAEGLTGWTLNEASGKPVQEIFKIINEFSRKVVDDPVSKVLEKGTIVGLANHTILVRKDGTEVAIDDSGAPIRNKEGEVSGVVLIFRDITERRKAEETLKQSEEQSRQRAEELQKLMDIIPAAIWVSRDPQCENITGNQAANKFYEARGGENVSAGRAEGSAQNYTRRFFQGNRELTPQELPMQEAAAKNVEIKNSELDVLLPSNRKISILGNAKPLLDNKGEVRGCLGVFMDVTERKQAEDVLKENEQLYRTVFDNSQDGFQLIEMIYDENGKPIDHKFLKVNRAYESIIGVKAGDILDKTARYISPNVEPHWLDVPDRVAKTRISEHVELYNKDIDKWLDCFYFPYSKNIVGTLFRDITERKKLEKQLQDSERLAAIGATAGMVGHDLRNPLQSIVGDIYLVKGDSAGLPDSPEKESIKEGLEEIQKGIDYINKIVSDLQDYAKPLTPVAKETDLQALVRDLLEKNGVPKNIKVSSHVDEELSELVVDADFLRRIIGNLISNAVQAMPNGGKLIIRAGREAGGTVITVQDTGVGIPEHIKAKLFTPLFTTKSRGQGFGLAVVKRMTEALGGTATFESEVGKGTKFVVRLPPPKEINGKWVYEKKWLEKI